jgi:hypothetical protein
VGFHNGKDAHECEALSYGDSVLRGLLYDALMRAMIILVDEPRRSSLALRGLVGQADEKVWPAGDEKDEARALGRDENGSDEAWKRECNETRMYGKCAGNEI